MCRRRRPGSGVPRGAGSERHPSWPRLRIRVSPGHREVACSVSGDVQLVARGGSGSCSATPLRPSDGASATPLSRLSGMISVTASFSAVPLGWMTCVSSESRAIAFGESIVSCVCRPTWRQRSARLVMSGVASAMMKRKTDVEEAKAVQGEARLRNKSELRGKYGITVPPKGFNGSRG